MGFINTSTITVSPSTIPWKLEFDSPVPMIIKPTIKKVIFNPPATIVFFDDGTKTVVKCNEDDIFNPWAGMALAICKKLYGSEFHKNFKKHCCDKEES